MTWSGVVQSVARQPLELDILVRVQAPEPPFHRFCDSCFNRRGGESLEILCFARLQSPANLPAADRLQADAGRQGYSRSEIDGEETRGSASERDSGEGTLSRLVLQ